MGTTLTWAIPTATTVNPVCSKCGTVKNSGKRSCCGHGGAWFNNCGNSGNLKFEHTWTEGFQACKPGISQSITTPAWVTPTITTASPVCTTCGTVKNSGKRSCCARGGVWFNKCGNPGDSNYGHTWTDGVQACNAFVTLFLGKVQAQVMLPHETTDIIRVSTPQKTVGSHSDTVLRD